jgi:hypothetical protein
VLVLVLVVWWKGDSGNGFAQKQRDGTSASGFWFWIKKAGIARAPAMSLYDDDDSASCCCCLVAIVVVVVVVFVVVLLLL